MNLTDFQLTILELWCMPRVGYKTAFSLLPIIQQGWRLGDGIEEDEIKLTKSQLDALRHRSNQVAARVRAKQLIEWACEENHSLLVLQDFAGALQHDSTYPPLLKQIHSPPLVLMVKGQVESLFRPCVAMVGSRNPSSEGILNAQQFSQALACAGYVVTSGGAKGIDRVCHTAVLQAGGFTVAVLGHGFDHCYPRDHRSLYDAIQEQGALVSEFGPECGPRPEFFPRRNRIITGLSYGVCVVEAGLPSGSLVSAKWAYEQGREVFAIPGSIHNPSSKGCHALIQQGAKLVESVSDIVSELGHLHELTDQITRSLLADSPEKAVPLYRTEDSSIEARIYRCLQQAPMSMQSLMVALQQNDVSELTSAVACLEIEGVLTQNEWSGYLELKG